MDLIYIFSCTNTVLHSVIVHPNQLIMETPNTKVSQKSRDGLKERLGDKYKVPQKAQTKENTKAVEIKLHTQQRSVQRAIFNYTVATKLYLMEQQKKQVDKIHKMIEEEEVKILRKEMIPRAQLMPLFDRPFFPQRSTRPLTVPREPGFQFKNDKCTNSFSNNCYNLYDFQHNEAH